MTFSLSRARPASKCVAARLHYFVGDDGGAGRERGPHTWGSSGARGVLADRGDRDQVIISSQPSQFVRRNGMPPPPPRRNGRMIKILFLKFGFASATTTTTGKPTNRGSSPHGWPCPLPWLPAGLIHQVSPTPVHLIGSFRSQKTAAMCGDLHRSCTRCYLLYGKQLSRNGQYPGQPG